MGSKKNESDKPSTAALKSPKSRRVGRSDPKGQTKDPERVLPTLLWRDTRIGLSDRYQRCGSDKTSREGPSPHGYRNSERTGQSDSKKTNMGRTKGIVNLSTTQLNAARRRQTGLSDPRGRTVRPDEHRRTERAVRGSKRNQLSSILYPDLWTLN